MSLLRFHDYFWVHVHLADVPGCFWYMGDDATGKVLTTDLLFAEAVEFVKLRDVADKIHRVLPTANMIEGLKCNNDCLTDEMKRTIRVV